MKKASFIAAALLCLLAFSLLTAAQDGDDRGLKPFGTYEGGNLDSIAMANGRLTLHIPLWAYPQRGASLRLGYFLNYTSNEWTLNQKCNQFTGCYWYWLWIGNCENALICLKGGIKVKTDQGLGIQAKNVVYPGNVAATIYDAVTPSGSVVHLYPIQYNNYHRSVDGTGILYLPEVYPSNTGTVWDREGNYAYPDQGAGTAGTTYDSNGNYVTVNSDGSYVDTLGRSIPVPVSTTDLSKCDNTPLTATSAATWSLPAPNNGSTSTAVITFCYVSVTLHEDGCDGGQPFDGTKTFIQSIVLPSSIPGNPTTEWKFEYQTNTGDLNKITLPTGGSISYTWQPTLDSCISAQKVLSRTVDPADGSGAATWNYNWSVAGQPTSTDPQGNDTVYSFLLSNGTGFGYETQRKVYQGSSTNGGALLKTVNTQYTPVAGAEGAYVGLPASITTIWPNGSSTSQSQVAKTWDTGLTYYSDDTNVVTQYTGSFGELTDQKEYDYGAGANGPLLRETVRNYVAVYGSVYRTPNNMLDLLSSSQVKNGAGTQTAYTTYGYDESAYGLVSSGITTQHTTPPNTSRGNQTSVNRWLSTSGTYLSSHNYFYDTGTVQKVLDPANNPTTYQYSGTFAGAYPTEVDFPTTHAPNVASHITHTNYDFNSGVMLSKTDENGRVTTYTYDLLSRPATDSYPDGGSVTYSYNDSTPPSSSGPGVTIQTAIQAGTNSAKTYVVDGLGRVTHWKHTTDPDGPVYVDTTYDGLGRKASVTNPYRTTGDSTYGSTQYSYDALSRVTTVTQPDLTTVGTVYLANCSTVTDEATKARKSCSDGLGRMTDVFEDPASNNYHTIYQYDALGNMTCTEQHGSTASASGCSGSNDVNSLWRIRRFTYDSLSRLLTAKNPETGNSTSYGIITYTYDSDSNLKTKQSPAPNQTGSSTITITYNYDEINRLTSKTYSDGTAAVYYGYDGGVWQNCTTTPPTPSPVDGNPSGERTSMCDSSGATAWTHDNMGRILQDDRKIIGTSTLTKALTYTYNSDGSLATLKYPSGRTITYTPGGAQRTLSVKDTSNSINYVTGATYAPQGAVVGFTYQATIKGAFSYNSRLQPLQMFYGTNTPPSLIGSACPTTVGNIMHRVYHFGLATNDNGNVQSVDNCRDTTRTANYLYDSVNRITSGSSTGTEWGDTYSVDAWGNLTNMNPIAGKTYTQNLQAAPATWKNQLNIAGQVIDAAGNMTNDGSGHSYVYDVENRLWCIGTCTSGNWIYTYDGDGKRVKKCNSCTTATGGTIYWTGDGSDNTVETDLAGNLKFEYIFFGGKRVARRDGTTNPPYYYFGDHLGSTSVLTNSTGGIQDESDYFPYGGEIPLTNLQPQNYKFTGKERDPETGLDYFGARYYGSTMGRWMSPDWAAKPTTVPYANFGDPQSLNLYSYVRNHPVSQSDPDGHTCLDPISCGAEGGAVVGTFFEPGGGTVVGAIIGGAIGGVIGYFGGRAIVNHIHQSDASKSQPQPKAGSANPEKAGKPFSETTKDKAREESGNKCVFCGKDTTREPGPDRSNIDHSIPKSRGGDNTIDNAQNTCQACNQDKGTQTTQEYRPNGTSGVAPQQQQPPPERKLHDKEPQ